MGFHPLNFGLPRPFRSRVMSRHATDRQTDRQTDNRGQFIMPPPLRGRGIIMDAPPYKCALTVFRRGDPSRFQPGKWMWLISTVDDYDLDLSSFVIQQSFCFLEGGDVSASYWAIAVRLTFDQMMIIKMMVSSICSPDRLVLPGICYWMCVLIWRWTKPFTKIAGFWLQARLTVTVQTYSNQF